MLDSGVELITLENNVSYAPTFVSTDKRAIPSQRTSLGYWRIGETAQQGYAKGPVFKIEFVDLTGVTAGYVRIWGIDNDDNAPVYPLTYFTNNPTISVYLKKFVFCDAAGAPVDATGFTYTIIGYKKRAISVSW